MLRLHAHGYALAPIRGSFTVAASRVACAAMAWGTLCAAPANSSAKTLAELFAQARDKPGAINFSSGGNGSPQHMAMEIHASAALRHGADAPEPASAH